MIRLFSGQGLSVVNLRSMSVRFQVIVKVKVRPRLDQAQAKVRSRSKLLILGYTLSCWRLYYIFEYINKCTVVVQAIIPRLHQYVRLTDSK